MHKYDMALDNFLLAEETNPYNPFIQYNIGSLFFKTGKLDKAIKYLKNSIKYKANFGSAFHKLANIMYKKKRFRAAINYYKKAIGFNTVSHTTYYFIGLSYLNIKNVSSAITSLNQSLKLKNNFFEAALEMGKIYHSYGEFQNAIKMYLWAESINAEHRNLRLWLSQCYSETGKYSSAIDIVKKLIQGKSNFYLVNNPDVYQAAAWNLGIQISHGEIIGIISSHSVIAPDYVSMAVETLLYTGVDMVGGPTRTIKPP